MRIPELEGLRGVLALWVVLGHWATSIEPVFAPIRQNLWSVQAVDLFIILSGFVIALLLAREQQRYSAFILRRWFRLAPVWLTVLVLSAILFPLSVQRQDALPEIGSMREVRLEQRQDVSENFTESLILGAAMLHGAVPLSVRPQAAYALVGQGWSISLEWQFYLLAPLLAWLIRRWRDPRASGVLVLITAGLLLSAPYFSAAWLGAKLPLFALGAGSFMLWRVWVDKPLYPAQSMFGLAALGLVVLALGARMDWLLAPALWVFCLNCLLIVRQNPKAPEKFLSGFLNLKPCQFLGHISYPLYLVHFLIIVWLKFWLQPLFSGWALATILLVALLPLSIIAAWVLSVLSEQPMIGFGKRCIQKLSPPP
jgi:peptidoglycan/LPS O-acetylase OafA/YrhL